MCACCDSDHIVPFLPIFRMKRFTVVFGAVNVAIMCVQMLQVVMYSIGTGTVCVYSNLVFIFRGIVIQQGLWKKSRGNNY